MSFFSENENFIRIKFYSDMKGMSFEKRISHYNTYLKYDTLKRLKEYLKNNEDELEIRILIKKVLIYLLRHKINYKIR